MMLTNSCRHFCGVAGSLFYILIKSFEQEPHLIDFELKFSNTMRFKKTYWAQFWVYINFSSETAKFKLILIDDTEKRSMQIWFMVWMEKHILLWIPYPLIIFPFAKFLSALCILFTFYAIIWCILSPSLLQFMLYRNIFPREKSEK